MKKRFFKKNFLTGLVLLLPAILTLIILGFIVSLLTDPFVKDLQSLINMNKAPNDPFISLHQSTLLLLAIRTFILISIFFFIVLIGYLTQTFLMYSVFKMGDRLIKKIPIINKIYKAIQDVINTIFSSKGTSFKQVVLVPYPNQTSLSVGFITSDSVLSQNVDSILNKKVAVFVAGAPNPTVGFILLYPKEDVIYINMKVEEAFKLLVSCGIMMPNLPLITDENASKN